MSSKIAAVIMRDKKVVRFFDEQARDYNGKYGGVRDTRSFIFSERKRIVLEMLGNGFERILDIGCGPGVYTGCLSSRCRELYGVDVSQEMIEIARGKKYGNVRFSVGSIDNLEFGDNFFDAVVCVGVLEYFGDVEHAVKEVARVTRKGGVVIFTAPNASSIFNRLDRYIRKLLKGCRRVIRMDVSRSFMNYDFEPVLFSRERVEGLLKKYGFRAERSVFHIFRLSVLNRISPRLSLFLSRRLNFISNKFLAINYIVKARRI